MPSRKTILYLLISALIIFLLVDCIGEFFFQPWAQHPFFDFAKIILPLLLLVFHSGHCLPFRRSLAMIVLFCSVGLLAEIIGLRNGTLFGSHYRYLGDSYLVYSKVNFLKGFPHLFNVPLLVVLYWGVFIYSGYSISNSFLFLNNRQKPSKHSKGKSVLVKLVILDALIVLAIDLTLDPLLVYFKCWNFSVPGLFYGVPLGNFAGWFLVAALSTGSFRTLEYYFPEQRKILDPALVLLPAICLGVYLAMVTSISLHEGLYLLIFVSLVTLLPIFLANFEAFFVWKSGLAKLPGRQQSVLFSLLNPLRRVFFAFRAIRAFPFLSE